MGSRPTGGVFYRKKSTGLRNQGKSKSSSRRAHSSVVEHRTAVPVVIGSNPIVPFFFKKVQGSREDKEADNRYSRRRENIRYQAS